LELYTISGAAVRDMTADSSEAGETDALAKDHATFVRFIAAGAHAATDKSRFDREG